MNMQPVTSSQIAAVGHDPETNTLRIEFKKGGVYEYEGVSAEEHQALIGAESIGRYFGQNLRSKTFKKLPAEKKE